jgi:hypothetical protein
MSNEDLIELSNLRVLLECAALKASLAFGDEDWEGNLVSAHHKLAMICKKIMDGEVVPPERNLHYDWEFHFALVRACNSRHMIAVFQNVYEKYIGYQLVPRNYRWAKAFLSPLSPIRAFLHCVFDCATYVETQRYWRIKCPIPHPKFGHGTLRMAANLAISTDQLPDQLSKRICPLANILCSYIRKARPMA